MDQETTNLFYTLYRTIKLMDQKCWEQVKEQGFTKNEVIVLMFLSNNAPLDTASDLIRYRGMSKAHACKSIDHLVQQGYLKTMQDQEDRRVQHLLIEPKAEKFIQIINQERNEFLKQLLEGLNETDLQALKTVSKIIHMNMKER